MRSSKKSIRGLAAAALATSMILGTAGVALAGDMDPVLSIKSS
jgi:hypothetical protein